MLFTAIVFDIGGVLFTNGTKKFAQFLQETYGVNLNQLKQILLGPLGNEYHTGHIGKNRFWQGFLDQLHLPLTATALEDQWTNSYGIQAGTQSIINRLKSSYRLYFLSNQIPSRVEELNRRYQFLSWFAGGIFSYEVGLVKPDPLIYQRFIDKFLLNPTESVYIDDSAENLLPAQKFGFVTILYRTPEQLEQELNDLKIL